MTDDLDDLRKQLRELDESVVDALGRRRALAIEIARVKAAAGRKIRDPERERDTIEHLAARAEEWGLDQHFIARVFNELIDHSVRVQETAGALRPRSEALVIGYQGGEGAYSHLAATRYFGASDRSAKYWGFQSFREMLSALKDGELNYAVLPIENSIAGSINESYDLLAEMDLSLVGEEIQPIAHCLIGYEQVPVSHIRRIYSHPVALAQCDKFLRGLSDCRVEAFRDTALAVSKVKEDADATQAAIASADAARIHGLPVLRSGIADHPQNYTRMVIVAREPEVYDGKTPCKTSLMFSTVHEQGALARCIAHFADRGLNLSKLESRPQPNTPFEYVFYADFEGNAADPAVQKALEELRATTSFLKVLGSYPNRLNAD